MRDSLLLCAITTVALAIFSAPVCAQSRCASARVSEVVFEKSVEFPNSVRNGKTLYMGVYHDLQSGLIDSPPPDLLKQVVAVLPQAPVVNKERTRDAAESQGTTLKMAPICAYR